ncbi:MAG TPA: hypothetical protein VI548_11860 [Chitinophagaceae bacterium]|nr:hypothetical protein [Chitinophagaceae bacterium]
MFLSFKELNNPVDAISGYLDKVLKEALLRGYNFDEKKISRLYRKTIIRVTSGQLEFEFSHLLKKLIDPVRYKQLKKIK